MKRYLICTLLALCALTVHVQAAGKKVTLSTGATLEIFQASADKANGCGVILCPGGGYAYLADANEGTDWAGFYNDLGFTIAVLRYRLPKTKHDVPLTDGRAAVKYFRDHAAELSIFANRVGVMGFSAGGHLASTIATHAEGEERPDFQILFYPVITMEAGKTHQGSIDELLGTNPSAELVELYSNQKHVDATTPPAYVTYSDNDGTVPPLTNGKVYYDALVAAGVPATLKTYPTGGHGWGKLVGEKLGSTYQAEMQKHFSNWLKQLDTLLPAVETFPEVTQMTVEADQEAVTPFNPLAYPNLQTIVVNSEAVATKNYSASSNLLQVFGAKPTEYVFGEGITALGRYILMGAENVTSVQLPSTLTVLNSQVFSKCTSLTQIQLPDGLQDIGISAFNGSGLVSLQLPAVSLIRSSAFMGCQQLASIEMAAGLDSIAGNVFKNCPALRTIKCEGNVPPRAAASFLSDEQKAAITLYVPVGSRESYAAKEAWQGFAAVEEFVPSRVGEITQPSGVEAEAYTLDGRRADARRRGIVIVGGKKLLRKDK